MIEEFEVSKDVYKRALCSGGNMAAEDKEKLFNENILIGYGLQFCKVVERNGKYICRWKAYDSCD